VGAVIVKDNRIISTWYNGTPAGYHNCDDHWNGDYTPAHHDWSAAYEIHAEMNAMLWAARKWNAIEWATRYCTLEPCLNCAKHLIWAWIEKVVFLDHYKHHYGDGVQEFFDACWKTIEQWSI
jgi:dCMP deaminase